MGTRLELQALLESVMASAYPGLFPNDKYPNKYSVYFQPPENITISYPAIIYTRSNEDRKFADGTPYSVTTRYSVSCIDRNPDGPIRSLISMLPLTAYDRFFKADGLNHDNYSIYF